MSRTRVRDMPLRLLRVCKVFAALKKKNLCGVGANARGEVERRHRAVDGRVARGRESERGLGDVGLPEARRRERESERAGCGATKMAARQRPHMRGRLGEGFLNRPIYKSFISNFFSAIFSYLYNIRIHIRKSDINSYILHQVSVFNDKLTMICK